MRAKSSIPASMPGAAPTMRWLALHGDRFLGALRFLTILPVRRRGETPDFGAEAFPAVGLLIGFAAVLADAALGIFPFELRNIGLVIFLAVLSGGIHHDGLADTLDALGGVGREERLRIMADGSIGTYAVLGLVLGVALKVSSLMLLGDSPRVAALLLAPAFGRLAMVLCAWRAPAAKPAGLGAEFCASLAPTEVASAGAVALLAAVALTGWFGILALLMTAAMAFAIRRGAIRRFGGVTGDVLGAAGEVVETVLLAVFAATRLGLS